MFCPLNRCVTGHSAPVASGRCCCDYTPTYSQHCVVRYTKIFYVVEQCGCSPSVPFPDPLKKPICSHNYVITRLFRRYVGFHICRVLIVLFTIWSSSFSPKKIATSVDLVRRIKASCLLSIMLNRSFHQFQIMGFRLYALNIMVIIFISSSIANSDSLSQFSDESSIFSDSAGLSSSEQELLAFNTPAPSLDAITFSSADTSDSLFGNTANDNDDLFLDESVDINLNDELFQLADCSSSSEDFPVIGRSRIVGRSDPPCPNPDRTFSDYQDQNTGRDVWSVEEVQQKQNQICQSVTSGTLIWGVCYNPLEVPPFAGTSVVPSPSIERFVPTFTLNPCTLGKSTFSPKILIRIDWLSFAQFLGTLPFVLISTGSFIAVSRIFLRSTSAGFLSFGVRLVRECFVCHCHCWPTNIPQMSEHWVGKQVQKSARSSRV